MFSGSVKFLVLGIFLVQIAGAHSIADWEHEENLKEESKKALLVTAESLVAAWQPFVDWKDKQGIEVEVIAVETIAKKKEGLDVQEKIRLFVRSRIEEEGVRWLILGGDSLPDGGGLVPDRDTFHENMWGGISDIPTDIYYLSATNWDADGDGIYGEFEDDCEAISYPDGTVGLGRIPVRTAADVQAYVEKIIAHESHYPGNDFGNAFLYTCTVAGAYPKVRRSWDDSISKVLTDGVVERYFANETPWDDKEAGDYPLSASNWVKLFNEGRVGKMHLHGHGILPGWVMEDNRSLFGFDHVAQLINENAYPMITTVSCFTGYYDAQKDPCIVEAMLRKPKAGAIAMVSPCREGKPHFLNPEKDFPLMIREGKLDGTTRTMTLFWEAGISQNLTAGEALMLTKAELAEDAKGSTNSNYHMCLCELNLLGDPTLLVHQTSED